MKLKRAIFAVFLPTIVMADDLYTSTIVDGCGDAYYYSAVLEPISYTCSSGQYLPAGAISCQSCPDGYTCPGGTFTFNANQTQGLSAGDILVTNAIGSCSPQFNQSFGAIFEPITYTCSSGYYLPAGNDWLTDNQGCTQCPANSYCGGGTYTFNETTASGATPCPNNQTSIAGSSSVDDCKTVSLTWISNGETYATTTCTINGLITLPEPPTRPGYVFKGWRVETNE